MGNPLNNNVPEGRSVTSQARVHFAQIQFAHARFSIRVSLEQILHFLSIIRLNFGAEFV